MSKTKSKHEWLETVPHITAQMGSRSLWVEDGVLGYATSLAEGETVEAALEDFAAGYDAGEEPARIKVRWALFEGGEEVDQGRYAWDYPLEQ